LTLFVVATPIGNLADLTPRAVEVLGSVDVVLAEDTRHSRALLNHAGIEAKLSAYHDHSSAEVRAKWVDRLGEGASLALISDAGTPAISDPGYALVRDAVRAGIRVVPVPGASAVVAFLCASGLPTDRFQFVGFAPRKDKARRELAEEWLAYSGTTVFYESPQRAVAMLDVIAELAPERPVTLGRELTKKFEEFVRGTAIDVVRELRSRDSLRGECVIGLAPAEEPAADLEEVDAWVAELSTTSLSTRDIVRVLKARLPSVPSDLYGRIVAAREE
jgi:16S rRNA (cytidine1402-2'-O)-methyltransferase